MIVDMPLAFRYMPTVGYVNTLEIYIYILFLVANPNYRNNDIAEVPPAKHVPDASVQTLRKPHSAQQKRKRVIQRVIQQVMRNMKLRSQRRQSIEESRQRRPSIEESRQRRQSIEESRQRRQSMEENRPKRHSIEESRQKRHSIKESRQRRQSIEESRQRRQSMEENRQRRPSMEESRHSQLSKPSNPTVATHPHRRKTMKTQII